MKTQKIKKQLTTKSGLIIPSGSMVTIKPLPEMPTRTLIIFNEIKVVIPTIGLSNYFDGFLKLDKIEKMRKKLINFETDSSVVKSMTNQNVEPDGYDPDGFPSILLALGLI